MTEKMRVETILKEAVVLEKAARELRELAGLKKTGKSVDRMSELLGRKHMRTPELAKKLGLAKVTVYTIGRKNRRRFSLSKGEWSVKH